MSQLRLQSSAAIAEADWLSPRLRPFGSGVAAVVPDGFPAYVPHPAPGARDERRVHELGGCGRLVWPHHASAGPVPGNSPAGRPLGAKPLALGEVASPPDGNLPADLLRVLCAVLAGHTSAADSCWFCLWDGYGWLHGGPPAVLVLSSGRTSGAGITPVIPPNALQGPRVRLPNREYLLLEGPLEAATELGWTAPLGDFVPQSPNPFWPRDHAWCVASEIDLFCTLVAGSRGLVEVLLADPRLETWEVQPGDPVRADSDVINT